MADGLRRAGGRSSLAAALGSRGHLPGEQRRPAPAVVRALHVPLSERPAHQGHIRNYTFGDVLVRYRTMNGDAVLSPFGFDSFGLPAENAAIKGGMPPRIYTEARIAELKASVKRLGAVYDWRRELRSHDPDYMLWNQVIFLKFLEAGLAYRAEAPVNWCPGCQTVLGERAGAVRRHLRAFRRRRRAAQPRAVVSSDHELRRRAASTPSTAWTGLSA